MKLLMEDQALMSAPARDHLCEAKCLQVPVYCLCGRRNGKNIIMPNLPNVLCFVVGATRSQPNDDAVKILGSGNA